MDTGATLHLLQDEVTPNLIDSVNSNKPVTGFSGNISQRVAREGYQHIHFLDPSNAAARGVTLKLPVSTMKNIEDNIFSASKLVKSMRFKCNLRPDPVDGEKPSTNPPVGKDGLPLVDVSTNIETGALTFTFS